jgi:hypothetical protein
LSGTSVEVPDWSLIPKALELVCSSLLFDVDSDQFGQLDYFSNSLLIIVVIPHQSGSWNEFCSSRNVAVYTAVLKVMLKQLMKNVKKRGAVSLCDQRVEQLIAIKIFIRMIYASKC